MTNFCGECGAQNDEQTQFCQSCGNKLSSAQPIQQAPQQGYQPPQQGFQQPPKQGYAILNDFERAEQLKSQGQVHRPTGITILMVLLGIGLLFSLIGIGASFQYGAISGIIHKIPCPRIG